MGFRFIFICYFIDSFFFNNKFIDHGCWFYNLLFKLEFRFIFICYKNLVFKLGFGYIFICYFIDRSFLFNYKRDILIIEQKYGLKLYAS